MAAPSRTLPGATPRADDSADAFEKLADAFETQWQALVASNEELTAASQCTRASSGAADAASAKRVLLEALDLDGVVVPRGLLHGRVALLRLSTPLHR